MGTIIPEGERIRKAIKWISSYLNEEGEKKSINSLIEEASMRYNLSPKEEEFLLSFYQEERSKA